MRQEFEQEYLQLGLKIAYYRKLRGLTQEELADRAELSKGFISQLERNLTSPCAAIWKRRTSKRPSRSTPCLPSRRHWMSPRTAS